MPPMGQRVMASPQAQGPGTIPGLSTEEDQTNPASWEWVWDAADETYSEFNFPDPKPCQEMETLCAPAEGQGDLKSVDWLIDFKIETYCSENNIKRERSLSPPLQAWNSSVQRAVSASGVPGLQHPNSVLTDHKTHVEKRVDPLWKTCTSSKRPPYNYNELIELALLDKEKLTVDEIYQWIAQRFPCFRLEDPQWKGCIRHRLSVNRAFVKVEKVGKCHLWTYQPSEDNNPKAKRTAATAKHIKNHWKKQKLAELEMERKRSEFKENRAARRKKKADEKVRTNDKKMRAGTLRGLFATKKNKNSEDNVKDLSYSPNLWTPELVIPSKSPDLDRTRSCVTAVDNLETPLTVMENGGGRVVFSPRLMINEAAVTMPIDMTSCQVGLVSAKAMQQGVRMLLNPDNTFLNPVSFREAIVESGLLDDPPSIRAMSVIPTQCQVPVVEMDTIQLFGDLFSY